MKLIDADKLIEELTNTINEWIEDMAGGEYLKGNVNFSVVARDIVRKQPTAFDVDKVTKKIREEIDKCNIKLNENPQTVNVLALCERRKALREALWYVDKDVLV